MESSSGDAPRQPLISRSEWGLIFFLSAMYFTHILDFMIIMPLGPQIMKAFDVNPSQFGLIIAMYGYGACLGSLCASLFMDRFDRKTSLLFLYAAFTISTLACGLAPSYEVLVVARAIAGASGGVVAVAILTIVGDLFADYRRGTATGAVMSSFAIASIAGVPIGLFLANHFDWSAPFFFLAGLCVILFFLALKKVPSLRGHMHKSQEHTSETIWHVLQHPNHIRAYLFSLALVFGSTVTVPYIATYMQMNVKLTENQIPFIYLFGGLCTLFSMNLAGRWADRYGKLYVFRIAAVASVLMTLILTNLPMVPLAMALVVTTGFMVATSARFVPAMAMITASTVPHLRGMFMSVNTSLQHLGSGLASNVGGWLLTEQDGELSGYSFAGLFGAVATVLAIYLAGRLRNAEVSKSVTISTPLSNPQTEPEPQTV